MVHGLELRDKRGRLTVRLQGRRGAEKEQHNNKTPIARDTT